jgi:hypothetical protein
MIQVIIKVTFEFPLPGEKETVLGSSTTITSKKDGDEDAIDHVNNVLAAVWKTKEDTGADANFVVVDILDVIKGDDDDDDSDQLRVPWLILLVWGWLVG